MRGERTGSESRRTAAHAEICRKAIMSAEGEGNGGLRHGCIIMVEERVNAAIEGADGTRDEQRSCRRPAAGGPRSGRRLKYDGFPQAALAT
jgi:hypothetical protein